jgi:hypothetical protein
LVFVSLNAAEPQFSFAAMIGLAGGSIADELGLLGAVDLGG